MNAEYSKADFGVPAKKSSSVSTVAKASQRTQAKDDYIPVAASPSAKKIRNSVKYVKPGGERERPKQVLRPVRLLKLMNGDGTTWIRRKDVDADILLGVTKETIRIQFKSKSGKRELNPIALQNVSSCCRASASEHGDKLLMLVISMSKGKSFTFQFPGKAQEQRLWLQFNVCLRNSCVSSLVEAYTGEVQIHDRGEVYRAFPCV